MRYSDWVFWVCTTMILCTAVFMWLMEASTP